MPYCVEMYRSYYESQTACLSKFIVFDRVIHKAWGA